MSKKEYPAKLTTGYYRVREVWEDEASQLGAYRLLANAKAKCDENPGSRVFDNDGNVIYPEEAVLVTGAEEEEEHPVQDEPEEKGRKPRNSPRKMPRQIRRSLTRRRIRSPLWTRMSSRPQRSFRPPLPMASSRLS